MTAREERIKVTLGTIRFLSRAAGYIGRPPTDLRPKAKATRMYKDLTKTGKQAWKKNSLWDPG